MSMINDLIKKSYDEEAEAAYESVLDMAMESAGHIISKEARAALPDSAFGIPGERKYPLVVKTDKKLTKELIATAISMFHFCKAEWRAELAKNIVKAIRENSVDLKISPKSQINRYTTVPENMRGTESPASPNVKK